jgi:acyl-CoA reductase-like NAD-dependent aldehyde dehydrogenase
MGGKDPAYVMAGADVDAAAETLVDAAMNNSGQCCCCIERIYVIESLYKDFVEKAVSVLHGCKVTGRGGALSVIGYHNLTRPKSYHFKKAT